VPAFALAIFTGALLLFQVQPLIGKYILPWKRPAPAQLMTPPCWNETSNSSISIAKDNPIASLPQQPVILERASLFGSAPCSNT
jgi:hypothetical protein